MSAQQFPAEMCTENNTLLDHKMDKGKKRFAGLHILQQDQSQKTSYNLQDLRDTFHAEQIFPNSELAMKSTKSHLILKSV